MLTSTLLTLCVLGSVDDARGGAGHLPEDAALLRTDARVRTGVHLGGFFGVANYDATFAAILSGDLGVVLSDRWSLYARLQGGSLGFSVIGQFSVVAELQLGEHFMAGLGVAGQGWVPLGYTLTRSPFVGLMFPLRVAWAPFSARAAGEVQRKGFVFSLEVAPGFGLLPTPIGPSGRPVDREVGLTASVNVGYAVW